MIKWKLSVVLCFALSSFALASSTYIVQSGDTAESIAAQNGVSVEALLRANPEVDFDSLELRLVLNVPSAPKKASTVRENPSRSHTVAKGENSWTIAQRYGISEGELKAANPSVNFSPLSIGAKLKIPSNKVVQAPSTEVSTSTSSKRYVKITKDNVILRTWPTTESKRKALLSKNHSGTYIRTKGEWVEVAFASGTTGWIRGDMVEVTQNAPAAPSARSQAIARSQATAKPKAEAPKVASTAGSKSVDSLLKTAYAQLGIRYVYGGTSRRGFDCSGFVRYVFQQHGVSLPRTSAEQWNVGTSVSKGSLQAGDLVFFRTRGSRISHVGIYIGSNKFIHASSGGGRIRVNELTGYYSSRYAGARRVSKRFAMATSTEDWDSYAAKVTEPGFAPDPEPLPEPITPIGNLGADPIIR